VRSDRVMAYPVRVGAIREIDTRIRPLILVYSSCERAKGAGLLSSILYSTVTRRHLSSRYYYCFGFPKEETDILPDPPEFDEVGLLLEKAEPGALFVPRKSAHEFFRVFAMSAKETDFEGAEEEGVWLRMPMGIKLAESVYIAVVRKLTTLSYMSCAKLRSSGFL
jgi:hypothetical protein